MGSARTTMALTVRSRSADNAAVSQRDDEPDLGPPLDDLTAGSFGSTPAGAFGLRAVLASYVLAISVTVLVLTALLRGRPSFWSSSRSSRWWHSSPSASSAAVIDIASTGD